MQTDADAPTLRLPARRDRALPARHPKPADTAPGDAHELARRARTPAPPADTAPGGTARRLRPRTRCRGVGYCARPECAGYLRGYLLSSVPARFECPICLHDGPVARERGLRSGASNVYSECRVEFDFDPAGCVYRQVARARDSRVLARHDVYVLQSPLVRTREEAAHTASALLKALNRSLAECVPAAPVPTRDQLVAEGWPILS